MPIVAFTSSTDGLDSSRRSRDHFILTTASSTRVNDKTPGFSTGRALPTLLSAGLLVLTLTLCHPAPAYSSPKPLFASEAILKLRIEAPFSDLIRAAPRSTNPFDAKITLLDTTPETHSIQLSARGISRRNPDACDFPPLKIEFKEKPGDASLFKGQKTLKLATHCRSNGAYQNYNLLEYAAYKLLNVLTPVSFRVRMAEIDYVEARTGSVRIHRLGFLVEDVDELAARNGLEEIKTDKIERAQLNESAVARSDLFQYMIGNQDWSNRQAAAGMNCCHNIKLLGASSDNLRDLIPVAYDFDSSGLVDAPYALPPAGVQIASVRIRSYRGLCQFNAQAVEAAHDALEKRADLLASISSTPSLSERSRKSATQYLEAFFNEIADPDQLKRHILDYCRN